jgi:ribosomal protein S18 acetylase RimI-like enzyme
MPPGKNMDDTLTVLRSGMWRLFYKLSSEGRARFFSEFLPLLHDAKHSVLGDRDPHSWYLVYIGTKEGSRGRGYARKLIEHVTSRCDRESRPCYLESSNDINPVIYRKMGFEVKKQIWLERGEERVRMDIMVREPATKEGGK